MTEVRKQMGPNYAHELANSLRDGIIEYRAVARMSESDIRKCILAGGALLEHAEHMNGKLALMLRDWLSVLTMVLEDKERPGL